MELTPEDFKHLPPDDYMPDGTPLFDAHTIAKVFGITPEEAEKTIRELLEMQQKLSLPMDGVLPGKVTPEDEETPEYKAFIESHQVLLRMMCGNYRNE